MNILRFFSEFLIIFPKFYIELFKFFLRFFFEFIGFIGNKAILIGAPPLPRLYHVSIFNDHFEAVSDHYGGIWGSMSCPDVSHIQFIDSQWRTSHFRLSNHPEMVKHGNLIGSINQIKQMLSDFKDTIDSSAILLSIGV